MPHSVFFGECRLTSFGYRVASVDARCIAVSRKVKKEVRGMGAIDGSGVFRLGAAHGICREHAGAWQ